MNQQRNLGICQFCGANNVYNPKTGKVFCGNKCWLNNQSNQGQQPVRQSGRQFNPQPAPKNYQVVDEEYWQGIREEKREGMAWGNAKACASELLAASISKGELTLEDALARFQQLAEQIYAYEQPNGQ